MVSLGGPSDRSWLELLSFDDMPQLVKFDPTANAPEHDDGAEAPEFEFGSNAPQAAYNPGPEVAYGGPAPIPITPTRLSTAERDGFEDKRTARGWRDLSRKTFWILFGVLCGSVIAIAVGVGVGTGVRQRAGSTQTTSVTQPIESPAPLNGVLDGSSFATVFTPEGNRHVFFQDRNGTLRKAEYIHTSSSWTAGTNGIIARDARKFTPLSAATQEGQHGTYIYLFYILADNTLGKQVLVPDADTLGSANPLVAFANMADFTAAQDSRSLSITIIPSTPTLEAYVFFEGVNGNMKVEHGRLISGYTNTTTGNKSHWDSWTWKDATDNFTSSLISSKPSSVIYQGPQYPPNSTIGAPFAGTILSDYNPRVSNAPQTVQSPLGSTSSSLCVAFTYKSYDAFNLVCVNTNNVNGSFLNLNQPDSYDIGIRHVVNSDIVMTKIDTLGSDPTSQYYVLWVDNTTLSFAGFDSMATRIPSTSPFPFPYPRLAVTSPINSTAFYLYHQINAAMITEDVWDYTVAGWVSSNIVIATT